MRFIPCILLFVSLPAWSQRMLDPQVPSVAEIVAVIEEELTRAPEDNDLSCGVRALDPMLNFSFRHQAGYRVSVPISQFPPEKVSLRIAVRVTSVASGEPFYFWQDAVLPEQPRQKNLQAEMSGGFFVGPGEYEVDFVMGDQYSHRCRKGWGFKLKPKGDERKLTQFVEPGQVRPLVLDAWEGVERERPYRIAVILHLSPLFPRSIRLSSYDQSLLVTTVTSLLEDTPFQETSVSGVNLQQQAEIFRTPDMNVSSFVKLIEAMEGLELGTIGIEQLSKPKGHIDLLARLINDELSAEEPPDAIVFIGPNSLFTEGFPRERIEFIPGRRPLFFYLHLDYYSRWWPFDDTIEKLTESQDGKVFKIHHPRQFASAIRKMEEMLEERVSF